jgi:hypothetical protein
MFSEKTGGFSIQHLLQPLANWSMALPFLFLFEYFAWPPLEPAIG